MEDIRQYIISVVAAAIISGIAMALIGKKGGYAEIVKLLCGLFVLITAIAPWTYIQIREVVSFAQSMQDESEDAVSSGQIMAKEATADIIKSQTEAYIMDKATALGLEISVEVTLDTSLPPRPRGVKIIGTASPFARQSLTHYIANELGIPEDEQLWI